MTIWAPLVAVVGLAFAAAPLNAQEPSQWKRGDQWELVFGSATSTGSYFAGMSALATVFSQKLPNVQATATVSPNSTTEVYMQMMRDERVGGLGQDVHTAYYGTGPWEGRDVPVLGWGRAQEAMWNIFVLERHGITEISQLKDSGLTIAATCAPPEPGNPARWDTQFTFFTILLEAHGVDSFKDVNVVPYCTSQAIQQLGDGNIDGMSHSRALGDGATMELMTKQDLVLLQPDPNAIEDITSNYPVYTKPMPADVYPQLTIPEPGVGFFQGVYFFLHEDLPDDLVYNLTKAKWDNIDVLRNSHPAYAGVSLETVLQGMPIPVHPGALRYYREQNVPGVDDLVEEPNQ